MTRPHANRPRNPKNSGHEDEPDNDDGGDGDRDNDNDGEDDNVKTSSHHRNHHSSGHKDGGDQSEISGDEPEGDSSAYSHTIRACPSNY